METQTITVDLNNIQLAPFGKRMIAHLWLEKGMSFVEGALLLKNHGGDHFVALHLFCQGTEIILKACLLMFDYIVVGFVKTRIRLFLS